MYIKSVTQTLAALSAGIITMGGAATAATVNVTDDTMTLSQAITLAYDDAEPAVVNLHVNALTTADEQILITRPITINGDADGDGVPCDILVDMTGIAAAADIGLNRKGYIEIQTEGEVSFSDLRIHPNADGPYGPHLQAVQALRIAKPENAGQTGNYTFTRVHISGSDGDNGDAYIPLDTIEDLYNKPNVKRWSGLNNDTDGQIGGQGVIQFVNSGDGAAHVVLDHCHAGLGQAAALNIPIEGGTVTVLGGVYGHCGRDGIRVSGSGVKIQGTHDDRVRIIRTTNITGANSHGLEVAAAGELQLLEYVDVITCNSGHNFSFRSGQVDMMRYCRGLGRADLEGSINPGLYLASGTFVNMTDCTIHGGGGTPNPLFTSDAYSGAPIITNSIFTTDFFGWAVHIPTAEPVTFVNCALPTDEVAGESLGNPPITGLAALVTTTSPIHESPLYALTAADYDWSDNQGMGQPGNGPGNANVLRPTNPNYMTAATDGNPLYGGAGEPASNIDPADWMLMQ